MPTLATPCDVGGISSSVDVPHGCECREIRHARGKADRVAPHGTLAASGAHAFFTPSTAYASFEEVRHGFPAPPHAT